MMKLIQVVVFVPVLCLLSALAHGQTTPRQVYFAFEPDITTHYVKIDESRHLGYVRVGIEAVVGSVSDLDIVEHHAPLLRDAFIQVLGEAQEGKVRSLTGRDEIRRDALARAQLLLEREAGREVIKDLIFTTYLYQ